ncbi:MAG: hypothetical protein NZZ41_01195 [Candidatus Dojkabacteria bacterium]|nr:hypothetical protein [Candidatus Dojkabacteria bacterium]
MKINDSLPFFSKSLIPGGILTFETSIIYKPNQVGKKENEEGISVIRNSVIAGDFLSFDYVSREIPSISEANSLRKDEKVVLNPLIVVSGYYPSKKLISGVDLRKFKISQKDSEAEKLFYALEKYYYFSEFDDKGNKILTKKNISLSFFNLNIAFLYKNFNYGLYSPIYDVLRKYFRLYNILKMQKCILLDINKARFFYNQTVELAPGTLD